MIFEHVKVDQGTPEWFASRLGKITASSFNKYVTATGKISSSISTMNKKLVEEKVTGKQSEYFQSDAMERGIEVEPKALEWFNGDMGQNFEPVGFFDSGKGYGVSPDAIDWTHNQGLEIKCPIISTHLQYLLDNVVPNQYYSQVQGQLMVSGFEHWWFVSYHPDVNKQLVIKVERDEQFIEKLRSTLVKNVAIIEDKALKLTELGVKAV